MKILKKWINATFIVRLLDLFDSEDHRERDYLKTILHRIYAKFMSLRAFIRKAINHVFFVFVYETERHNGISELLEILGSIINGFALPLKQEHKTFLKRVLLPLHSARNLATFHQQLAYCVAQFVDKDPTLAAQVLSHLIKYWPHQAAQKQLLFLNELEELLELCQAEQFKLVAEQIARRLSAAIASPHFQVAERALFLWHNEYVANLLADHRQLVLPILYPTLYINSQPPYKGVTQQQQLLNNNNTNAASTSASTSNSTSSTTSTSAASSTSSIDGTNHVIYGHWNPTVNSLTVNVLKIFSELDGALIEECQQKFELDRNQQIQQKKQAQELFIKIQEKQKDNPLAQSLRLIEPAAHTQIDNTIG
jgi:serine/threonine-protein phosphatase 2A regulatory subunit B'